MSNKHAMITKQDIEHRLVYGEVYAPNVPDSDGDFMDAETIVKAAHKFMESQNLHQVDKQHDNKTTGAYVVESFIARKGDPDFIEGSWVVGVHIPDEDLWAEVKKGNINGFSMQAMARGVETTLEMDIPDSIIGRTSVVEEHSHDFFVTFSNEGVFLGGHTSNDDNHFHTITTGTQTNKALDHAHLFSFMEKLV